MLKDRILVGRFGASHGVGGELLTSFTGVPCAIAASKPLFDESGTRRFSIVSLRPTKHNTFVAKIAGVNDRASAGTLTHAELFVSRASLPVVGGEEFGSVVNVLNCGGGDILDIARADGGETLFLPFTKAVFPQGDIEVGRAI